MDLKSDDGKTETSAQKDTPKQAQSGE